MKLLKWGVRLLSVLLLLPQASRAASGDRDVVGYLEHMIDRIQLLNKFHGEPGQPHRQDEDRVRYRKEEDARRWMRQANRQLKSWTHRMTLVTWDFITNITDHNQAKMLNAAKGYAQWFKSSVAKGRTFQFTDFRSRDLRRQFRMFTLSSEPSDPQKSAEIDRLQSTMEEIYNTAVVCLYNVSSRPHRWRRGAGRGDRGGRHGQKDCLPLEPELQAVMAESREPEVLLEAWRGWREVAGKPQRARYTQLVDLLNQGARENGYSDYGISWREAIFPDNTDVKTMVDNLWQELRPLYLQLHAYVRRRLRDRYGSDVIGSDGAIPAHLLGNMWAQEWQKIYPLVVPYPARSSQISLDSRLKAGYDVEGMFRLSERFYASMGLFNMTPAFWERSMFFRPADRDVQCHASATDFFSKGDFRIKMCTEVTMDYLETIHHEMGHVQYFMAYAGQPPIFRDGANCAFHEAIGDTAGLSAMSRTHLLKLGLYPSNDSPADQRENEINDLMKMALTKIAFLPFGLVVDRWRWQVFSNVTSRDSLNRDWWKLRLDVQGVKAPVPRSERDFDPAAKFHVTSNSPYICYFVSHVTQFQFYKALCDASGHTGALHLCDFSDSVEAGAIFRRFMAAGASRPWQDLLQEFTGSRQISAQPITEYFRPLLQWLEADNARHGEPLGWPAANINWTQD